MDLKNGYGGLLESSLEGNIQFHELTRQFDMRRKFKLWFAEILIKILRRMKVAVILNFKVEGRLQSKVTSNFYYDSDIYGNVYLSDGQLFEFPPYQKFRIETFKKSIDDNCK